MVKEQPMPRSDAVEVSPEVAAAVADGRPVLALESTIFTHGLPRPRNLEVALDAEQQLRGVGVVPATIGVVDGTPVVGLSTGQIERLGTHDVRKVSVRDLPAAAATRSSGGTTVASTAYLARGAGIRFMSTGGLGGVHHGAATTFDESADLVTLAATPVTIVCAGVKSILDIPATLERMETLNITVLGFGTNRFPAFYVRDSGLEVEYRVDDAAQVAAVAASRDALGLRGAVVVANPVAADRQLSPELHDRVLREAFEAAGAAGVTGHDTTPFLLDFMQRETQGESLTVNVEVYRANVALGAEIARAAAG
jgi:pseudouridine-5'-phosphate glycosidase